MAPEFCLIKRTQSVSMPYADIELRILSIGKARKLLGYEPKIDLEEGLKRTIEYYRQELQENEK